MRSRLWPRACSSSCSDRCVLLQERGEFVLYGRHDFKAVAHSGFLAPKHGLAADAPPCVPQSRRSASLLKLWNGNAIDFREPPALIKTTRWDL